MNTFIIFTTVWTILGFLSGFSILAILSMIIIDANNDDFGEESNILYKTIVLLGGPAMWIFAFWVERQSLVEDL